MYTMRVPEGDNHPALIITADTPTEAMELLYEAKRVAQEAHEAQLRAAAELSQQPRERQRGARIKAENKLIERLEGVMHFPREGGTCCSRHAKAVQVTY